MRLNDPFFTILLTCITMLAVVSGALAQSAPETAETYSKPYRDSGGAAVPSTPRPVYSRPYTNPVPHAGEKELDKVTHLRRAAQHLEAAGKPELARRVAKEALLQEKLEQIRKLQAEVEELRKTTTSDRTVTLHVKIMELQVTKMRELGFDFQTADGGRFEQITGDTLVKLGEINGLIQTLREHDLIKVLAEPTLVTVSGRRATFQNGGEFPIVVPQSLGNRVIEYRQFGTRLDCLAKVLNGGRIRLELCSTASEIDTSRSVMIQDTSVPGLRTRSVDTAVEMEAGETLVLSGMVQTRPKRAGDSGEIEDIALLVTVTANLSEPLMQAEGKGLSQHR